MSWGHRKRAGAALVGGWRLLTGFSEAPPPPRVLQYSTVESLNDRFVCTKLHFPHLRSLLNTIEHRTAAETQTAKWKPYRSEAVGVLKNSSRFPSMQKGSHHSRRMLPVSDTCRRIKLSLCSNRTLVCAVETVLCQTTFAKATGRREGFVLFN